MTPRSSSANPSAPKVLIADDHAAHRTLATTLFAALGCQVETARDGREATIFAHAKQFDIIVLDRNMPYIGGDQAAILIRTPLSLSKKAMLICHSTASPSPVMADLYDVVAPKPLTVEDASRLLEIWRDRTQGLVHGGSDEAEPAACPPRWRQHSQ